MNLSRKTIDELSCSSEEDFIAAICRIIEAKAVKAVAARGMFTLVLSGGNTPQHIFPSLACGGAPAINWSCVHVFFVDERCVPPDAAESNFGLADRLLLSVLPRVGSVHRICGELEPDAAAQKYDRELREFFALGPGELPVFDLMLLGMGGDGHVASIFPGSRELHLPGKLVLATEQKYHGHYRITLGLDTINRSHCNLLMINNEIKMRAFSVSFSVADTELPVGRLKNVQPVVLDKR